MNEIACQEIINQCTLGNAFGAPLKSCFLDTITEFCGYNQINTVTYAIIALAAAYLIYRFFAKHRIEIDAQFLQGILGFVLFGSTMRVVTDAVTTGVYAAYAGSLKFLAEFVINSHIYDYTIFTTTPGIYVLVGALALASLYIAYFTLKKKEYFKYAGFALFIIHFILLAPLLSNFYFGLVVLALVAAGVCAGTLALKAFTGKLEGFKLTSLDTLLHLPVAEQLAVLAIFAHALDGASTYVIIDLFSKSAGIEYFEQHVLPRLIGSTPLGFFAFFLIKIVVSTAAGIVVLNDKSVSEEEKRFLLMMIVIFGLAPGARDFLRLLAGA